MKYETKKKIGDTEYQVSIYDIPVQGIVRIDFKGIPKEKLEEALKTVIKEWFF